MSKETTNTRHGNEANANLIFRRSIEALTADASGGNPKAQLDLGMEYYVGLDSESAVYWFEKAARQDEPCAQYMLARCYECGRGVEQSARRAIMWYTQAAEQGYADAQYSLGVHYYEGEIVEQNLERAARLFQSAAEQGDPDAQYYLATCYEFGEGVEQSYESAVEWYGKAACGKDDGQICFALGEVMLRLGLCYEYGRGVKQDYQTAMSRLKKAADMGKKEALFHYGKCLNAVKSGK